MKVPEPQGKLKCVCVGVRANAPPPPTSVLYRTAFLTNPKCLSVFTMTLQFCFLFGFVASVLEVTVMCEQRWGHATGNEIVAYFPL